MDAQNRISAGSLKEEIFRQILDNINTSVVIIDSKGYIIYANKASENLLNVSLKEIKNSHYAIAFSEIPESERFILQTLETGKEFKDIGYNRPRYNNRYIITDTVLLHDGEKKNIIGAAGVIRDITVVQELQNKLREKEKLSAMGEVAKGMAHEIRNPITSIQLFLQMTRQKAQDGKLSPDFIINHSNIVLSEVKKISQLINDFLEIAKPALPTLQPRVLKDLIEATISSITPRIDEKKINLVLDLDERIKIRADKESFAQMLIYILENAIDILPLEGMLKIKSSLKDDRVLLEIIDNGVGMTPEVKDNIFLPFYTTKDYGTGLGLALVEKIVHDHEGEIEVESEIGKGTNFKIMLLAAWEE